MSLTRRGRKVLSIAVVVVLLGGGLAAWAWSGHAPALLTGPLGLGSSSTPPPPPPCPLTGLPPAGGKPVPQRPVAAVKVENTVDAYPLVGLQNADIIYEELVEGGITRFMAVYQCKDAPKVGPVRSARTTDPKILVQFNKRPILGYSGAQLAVTNALKHAGIAAYDETTGGSAFSRAPAPRVIPHNLFVSVPKLYARAGTAAHQPAPKPVFSYGVKVQNPSRKVTSASIPFSTSSVGDWKWNAVAGTWVRQYNGTPMMLESAGPLQVTNVLVQEVVVTPSTTLFDVNHMPSPEVTLVGSGRVWLLRNGRMVQGTWQRTGPYARTTFTTKKGDVLTLAPGTTFVELMPKGMTPTFAK